MSAAFLTPLLFAMCYVPFNKYKCVFFRPVDISVPGLCWATDAKLAGGGGSPWRHGSSSPAGGFAESEIPSAGLLLIDLTCMFLLLLFCGSGFQKTSFIYFALSYVASRHTVYSKGS